ncbi:MAG: OmpA family protein [Saprospiraceae bacterium]
MYRIFVFFVSLSILSISCVLPSKYEDVVEQKNRLLRENESLEYIKEQSVKDKEEISSLKDKIAETEAVMFEINTKYTNTKSMYDDCQTKYDNMLNSNKQLLEKAFAERTNLSDELAQKEKELTDKEKSLKRMESDLNNQKLAQDILKNDLDARKSKIDSLTSLIYDKDAKLKEVRTRITDLLSGYNNDEIVVEKRSDGKLYISMSQELLFKKGSDKLDSKGISAIGQIAGAIKSETGFNILVEGHTDSDGSPSLNWDLSVSRALAVVKVLEQNGVMPQKITAAGRGQYMPVLPNTTEENKSKNRRTEIILEPDINHILDLLN